MSAHDLQYENFEEHEEFLGELAEPLEENPQSLEEKVDFLMEEYEFEEKSNFYSRIEDLAYDPQPEMPSKLDSDDIPSTNTEPEFRYKDVHDSENIFDHQGLSTKTAVLVRGGNEIGRCTLIEDADAEIGDDAVNSMD